MMESSVTASAIINFAQRLEDEASKFYKELANMYSKAREAFLAFVKEGEKNKMLLTRTYQETITDAIEACFSFKDLNLSDYLIEMTLARDLSYSDALKIALKLEEKAIKFYSDIAEQSRSLLATIPRAFKKVAQERNARRLKLKSLLNSLK